MNISILGSGGMNPMHKHSFCTQQNIYNMRVNDLKQTPKITKASFINSPRCFKFLTCSESQSRCLSFSSSHPACFLSQQRQWSPALLAASEIHHYTDMVNWFWRRFTWDTSNSGSSSSIGWGLDTLGSSYPGGAWGYQKSWNKHLEKLRKKIKRPQSQHSCRTQWWTRLQQA